MSLYIATLAELKSDLGIADTNDDAALTRLMEGLQGRFDSHLNRTLLRGADVEEVFDGGLTQLPLARFPVESVSAVYEDLDGEFPAGSLIEEYRVHLARGLVMRDDGRPWNDGVRCIKVVYTGGYVAAGSTPGAGQEAMPEDLRRAFLMQACFEWRNRTTLGKSNISAQGISVAISPARFLPEVSDCLAPLRRLV